MPATSMGTDPSNTDEGYFNDLSRQPTTSLSLADSNSPTEQTNPSPTCEVPCDGDDIPKTKRIACVICRKRKLKCDGNRPKCSTCARLGHNCAYDEARRKSGPKRGYVKELEARLAQVEAQFKDKDIQKSSTGSRKTSQAVPKKNDFPPPIPELNETMDMRPDTTYSMGEGTLNPIVSNDPFALPAPGVNLSPELLNMPDIGLGMNDNFSWEMIGLGLEEPMPLQEAIDELTHVFFEKIHPSLPFLHKYRYQASMNLSPASRPPICLRYAMWSHAASITEKYMHHQEIFYRRARKYIDLDEMKGSGEVFVSIAHAQTWILIATYEFKMMYFPRAWMSVGRAARMVLMMGLNRVDGLGLDVKQCLPPPRDWTEREERRRTFWMAYCVDRYASIGTGWPMTIDERDINSHLPATEENYENSTPQKTAPLNQAMTHEQVSQLSSLAGVVYITHFFGLNLTHLHRPEPNDNENDLQGQFWKRHRQMDNILLNTSLSLPSHLRLPAGVRNPNIVFLNFAIHTSTVCLHQAAIFKAEKNELPQSVVDQSRTRCILAASEIASVMRLTSHLDVAGMNPFMAFCLYVASRVFVQFLKKSPDDQEIRASLEFLLTAMSALRRKNPLTESFMVQLNLDIEGSGLDILLHNPDFTSVAQASPNYTYSMRNGNHDTNCPIPQYGKPNPSDNGDGSSEGQRRDSTRTTDWQSGGPPSIRTESPRQTPYALGNIQLQAMNNQQDFAFDAKSRMMTTQAQGMPGIFPRNEFSNVFSGEEVPVGMSPVINNNINLNLFDTDMSDATNHTNSTGLTPASSHTNPSGANSTYSPPQVEDDDSGIQPIQPQTRSSYSSYAPNKLPNFSGGQTFDTGGVKSPGSAGLGPSDPFKVMTGWDGNSGSTPGFSGMTPGADWEKLMQDGGWEKMIQDGTWFDQNQTMSPR